MVRRVPLLVAVVTVLLACATAAQARIVVGVGMAGIRLGDSAASVKQKLGAPQSVMHHPGDPESIYNYTRRKLLVRVRQGRGVIELNTFSAQEKTTSGLGVGSLLSAVDKAYPGSCQLEFGPHCAIAKRVNGRRTTTQFDAGASRDPKHVGAVKIQWLLPLPR